MKRRKLGQRVNHSPAAVFLNMLISRYNLNSVLEIGSDYGYTAEQLANAKVVAVDPDPKYYVPIRYRRRLKLETKTSDEFFRKNSKKFNLIYIDGLHTFKQVTRDLINSIKSLRDNSRGFIVIDDIYPNDRFSILKTYTEAYSARIHNLGDKNDHSWTGDVYKIVFLLHKANINFYSIKYDGKVFCLVILPDLNSKICEEIISEIENLYEETCQRNLDYEDIFKNGLNEFNFVEASDVFDKIDERIFGEGK